MAQAQFVSTSYDPFARGPLPAGVRTVEILDAARQRLFPTEIWYPAEERYRNQDRSVATQDSFAAASASSLRTQMAVRDASPHAGTYPLVVFSHGTARWGRRMATYLCTHLCSHGYVVAAMDHSELVAPELARRDFESLAERRARVDGWIASRVPDLRFLLDCLFTRGLGDSATSLDRKQAALVGYSFGGWAVLAASDVEPRVAAVIALAPAGSSQPKPGMIPVRASFERKHSVATLYLVAENDTMISLDGVKELFARTPEPKQMFILQRADHTHFLDGAEEEHELVRSMPFTGELAWIPKEMHAIEDLCSGEQAHAFVDALAQAHLDATLKRKQAAKDFLDGNVQAELARNGIHGILYQPPVSKDSD